MKQLEKNLPGLNQAALQLRTLISPDTLKEDMLGAITDRAFIGDDALPRNEKNSCAETTGANTTACRNRSRCPHDTEIFANECQPLIAHLSSASAAYGQIKPRVKPATWQPHLSRLFQRHPMGTAATSAAVSARHGHAAEQTSRQPGAGWTPWPRYRWFMEPV